ncbi:MAG TPA: PAS domain S-box protein, partial [Gammaproteobacteria bacterium]|nr:PAS domain S-box protein [Gammaproteobacteria bacterium]
MKANQGHLGEGLAQQLPLECGYCLVDEGYRICVWTFGAGAITGVSAAEAINRDLADLVPAGPRDALLAGVDRVINGARDRVLVDCDAWLPGLQVRLSASIGGLGGRQCLLRMERADPGPGSGGLLPDTPTLVIGRDGRVHDANSAAKRLCSAAGVALVEDLLPPGLASRAWEGLAHSDRLNAHWKVGDVAIDWSLNYISDADEIHAWGIVRNNLENYRRILENSVDGIFQTSRTGRILYVNAELATLFGYASPEKMSAEIRNLQRDLYSDAEERQRFIDILDRDGEVRGFETRMRRRDGTAVWVQLNARAVADNAGVPQFYVGTVYDISTLKALESEARERQERYRSLVHAAGTAICFVDADGIIREWNPTAADLTGFSWTEAIGRHFATMLSGDATHRTELAERVHAWMTEGSATDEELIIRHRDGGHRLLQWNARAHLDQGGGLQGVICVGQDMTERKAVEMALRRAEKNYRGIFENATDGIYQTDANGRLLSANPALAAIFGYSSAAEMVGEGLDLSHLIPDAHALEGVMTQLSEQRAVHGLEQRIRLHDGSFAWISLSARTVADGDSPRIEGVVVDITERHKAAERLDFIAHHDGLTRLANRHAFQEALARMVEEVTGGTRSGFALLLIDL